MYTELSCTDLYNLQMFFMQVGYTVEGWLDKNKDPLNDSVVELLKKSSETFISSIWSDYLGEGMPTFKFVYNCVLTTMFNCV